MSAVCLNLKCKILIINNLYNTVKILFLLNASMVRSNLGSKLRYQLNFQIIRKKKLKKYVLFFLSGSKVLRETRPADGEVVRRSGLARLHSEAIEFRQHFTAGTVSRSARNPVRKSRRRSVMPRQIERTSPRHEHRECS